ncbi:hypothetical protein SAMD00019534_019030 [Acytostelium subglobosum LB1]|uniref:hypothetical protein n=1 Tax=Acytostelium subglobosum LB1 TaxID=1410327 RepID=UPI000644CC49|nr:hypothetical protein SAMD00019534_019030 [Acytostelium subglobosum LB1]GAM18728.1 hypothetical protein SAMD00019534_019030 [Acytostelium subglobosum LB1]|eukprot:XP_012757948.1 hypothetical protein SAMD00019534_019030 [Acytostelium subglobosum LB1]
MDTASSKAVLTPAGSIPSQFNFIPSYPGNGVTLFQIQESVSMKCLKDNGAGTLIFAPCQSIGSVWDLDFLSLSPSFMPNKQIQLANGGSTQLCLTFPNGGTVSVIACDSASIYQRWNIFQNLILSASTNYLQLQSSGTNGTVAIVGTNHIPNIIVYPNAPLNGVSIYDAVTDSCLKLLNNLPYWVYCDQTNPSQNWVIY